MRKFKDLIRERRLEIGKTLEQIGKEAGVAKATVQRWESGEIKDMRQGKLAALAKALHTTPAYLMGWEETDSLDADNTKKETERKLLFLARKTEDLPPEEQKKIIQHFEDTIDLYLSAKKFEDQRANRR